MDRENQNQFGSSPLISICEEEFDEAGSERKCEKSITKNEILEEVKKQLCLAGPLMAVSLLQKFVQVGMASALDTLSGQSFGAKQYHMLGIHMQRAMFVLLLVSIPLAITVANTRSILIFVGQNADIAAEAGKFAHFLIPGIFGNAILACQIRFLRTQNIVLPMVLIAGFTTLLHIFTCWFLLFKSGLGNRGAALANSISYWINVILLALYVKFSPSCSRTWTGFSMEALQNCFSFLGLAIPSAFMTCLEFWSFELMVLLSGILPNPELETSVLSISLNISTIVWRIPSGLGGAVSIRVSNELGAGHPRAARLAAYVVTMMGMSQGVVVGVVLILTRKALGYAYSSEIEVVKYVEALIPILATANFVDGIQCGLSGIVRGCGWQRIGAFVNLGSYYLVGIPSAILFAFVFHMGGKGLWLGIIGGLIVQVSFFVAVTIRTNWKLQAKKATERVCEGT
ncbi:hypothetical protein FEM48_Zijuj05G0094700 [Ziziphus jujuba var. spinosa]|uniref:Protein DETOXIFICATION n=1 Tax=Ziziphus jujuba var. spinosa TaxID=714518 RepID=A0A978VE62_ZIZJJ|nr:hypothetical protein FEM48_Zijuj05G0094700 [Ziziphus jujuba var. spinosa]